MSQNWDFYFTSIDEAPASVSVDLGLAEDAPDKKRSFLAWVWVHMDNPREDGMPTQPESERIASIEVHLSATLEQAADAVYVGRVTAQGRRELYFYVADGSRWEALVAEATAGLEGVRIETGVRQDPEWRLYFEALFPTPEDLEVIQNRRVVQALQERGDNIDVARPVHHTLTFMRRQEREAFIQEAKAEGYEVGEISQDREGGRQRFRVSVVRTHAVDWDTVNEITLPLVQAAKRLKGTYDGWKTEIVRREAI